MKTTIVDKSVVKTYDDFKKLKWTDATHKQKAAVYGAMSKMTSAVKKTA